MVGCADGSACEANLHVDPAAKVPQRVQSRDLVNFRPVRPVATMEPDGWLIVGLDTNFAGTAESHVLTGELLGLAAEVRFAPDRYHWSYGDGTTATIVAAGSTWDQLGVPEFSRTATSHVFRASGVYAISLEESYSAEHRFAGLGWQNITGAVSATGIELVAVAARSRITVTKDSPAADRHATSRSSA